MAKRPTSNDEMRIKLGLDGQAEWDAFRKQLKGIAGEVQAIAAEMKRIDNIAKAASFKNIMSTPGGSDQAIAGARFQGGRRARNMMQMGTESGQNLQNLKDDLALNSSIEKVFALDIGVLH